MVKLFARSNTFKGFSGWLYFKSKVQNDTFWPPAWNTKGSQGLCAQSMLLPVSARIVAELTPEPMDGSSLRTGLCAVRVLYCPLNHKQGCGVWHVLAQLFSVQMCFCRQNYFRSLRGPWLRSEHIPASQIMPSLCSSGLFFNFFCLNNPGTGHSNLSPHLILRSAFRKISVPLSSGSKP